MAPSWFDLDIMTPVTQVTRVLPDWDYEAHGATYNFAQQAWSKWHKISYIQSTGLYRAENPTSDLNLWGADSDAVRNSTSYRKLSTTISHYLGCDSRCFFQCTDYRKATSQRHLPSSWGLSANKRALLGILAWGHAIFHNVRAHLPSRTC